MSTASQSAFIACNVYISSALSTNSILQKLLKRTLDRCRYIREHGTPPQDDIVHHNGDGAARMDTSRCDYMSNSAVAVIHAFADVPYNRSSFHLAGRSDCVADVALDLILNSFDQIAFDKNAQGDYAHPFVGLVDHVSVMPLVSFPVKKCERKDPHSSQSAAVHAAKSIGNAIRTKRGQCANVYYYGLACSNKTPLAQVRKEQTSFFMSGNTNGVRPSTSSLQQLNPTKVKGDCTIGVPDHFVENYNIRLSSNVSFGQAKTLTQYVRGRNRNTKGYGIEGVEALTLPYQMCNSNGEEEKLVYEVACNLTNPTKGSAYDIERAVSDWIDQQVSASDVTGEKTWKHFIEKMYRVGTTEKQCVDTLLLGCNEDEESNLQYWNNHDRSVLDNFEKYLRQEQV